MKPKEDDFGFEKQPEDASEDKTIQKRLDFLFAQIDAGKATREELYAFCEYYDIDLIF